MYSTIIGAKTSFKGFVELNTDILICGEYEGDIVSTATVEVEKCGRLNAKVKCKNLIIKGVGEGEAVCSDCFTVIPGGSFTGDVETSDMCAERGSIIDGKIKMTKNK